jgi:phage protein D
MTDSSTQPRFFSARPSIRVDARLEPALGEQYLTRLLVEETTQGLFRCEATFVNWGPRGEGEGLILLDRQLLDFGKPFSVEFGPPDNSNAVFAGRITGIEAHYPQNSPPEVTVLAEDRFQDLRMERRTRTFEDSSDEDVIRAIASAHGLTPELDIEGPTYRVLAQVNQSDLAFLRERAAALDAELWIDNRTLYAQMRSRRNAGPATFTHGSNLLTFSALADLAHQRTAVHVCGWDIGTKRPIDERADAAALGGELGSLRGGSAILGQALAAREERIVSAVPLSSAEARGMAEARYRERARRFVRGSGTVDGNVKVRVGTHIELSGLGAMFDGPYYVTLARHTFDLESGFRTFFECERPGIG